RRHTSFSRDWSSDVCSSDLADAGASVPAGAALLAGPTRQVLADIGDGASAQAGVLRVTHAADALDLAVAMIPAGRQGHIVLTGDTARDPVLERRLAQGDIIVDHLVWRLPAADEIYVDRLDMP